MTKLAVIGAGVASIPFLKKAREKNVYTICVGEYSNSIGRDFCDEFLDISIFDVEEVVKELKAMSPDGIVASSESTTEVTAIIANSLQLPGNSIKKGFGCKNKYVMRQRVKPLLCVKQPQFALYENGKQYEFPIIVKAIDSCGKKGISIAQDEDDLNRAIQYAMKYSTDGNVLIEEYIEGGQEYSIECLVDNGKCFVIQLTEKETSGPPHFVELGHHQPAIMNDELRKRVEIASNEILYALGLTSGMAHLELKIVDSVIYFIEVGARAGGDRIADTLVGLSTDFDYYSAAIDIALRQFHYTAPTNIAHSGIYFLCKQTEWLVPLFRNAKGKNWCIECEVADYKLSEMLGNTDSSISGYLIYQANHRICLEDNDFANN
ncbi:biotin carboxylase [Sphaerochaeta pleomorpha str. Grapes]|uniref:Biotin carboxylase n=1 Tax=Sphaerochaeta pleomorpha (strain ATCC BAA-1885 / DSM 22778 / Grapes) TaxID=158190 RepID=G8QWW2_SPHPG|nr:ATP-grasp domain-containing protein [Sphaerochaeta pleomorpha]AEV29466.1 biotin carboxylase [Sphaerochaeta pleomorpha str. Grapes]